MKKTILATASLALLTAPAWAGPDDDSLVINDEIEIVTETAAPAHLSDVFDTIYSGWRFRTDETQALEMDDFDNPAMLTVDAALDYFSTVDGTEGKSCSSCHEGPEEFAGFTTTMPKVIDGKLTTLEDLINGHRAEKMGAEPWKWSGDDMQGMVALIGLQ